MINLEYSEYTAVEGMTWGEWLSSEYNVNNYTSDSGMVMTPDAILYIGIQGKCTKTTDIIIAGQKYDVV